MAEEKNHISPIGPTSEELAREWWQQRFGTALPEDAKSWLRSLIRQEVTRARLEANLLDDVSLQRVREGRRLQQTKLNNVEENLRRVVSLQEQTRRFIDITSELELLKKNLYNIGKQQASLLNRQRELERFEAFEPINAQFQRVRTLSEGIQKARKAVSQIAQQIEDATRSEADAFKALNVEQDKRREALANLSQAALTMAEGERLTEKAEQQEARHRETEAATKHLQEKLTLLRGQLADLQSNNERLNQELTGLKLKRQGLEAHHQMIGKSEAVLVMLDEYLEAVNHREELTNQYNQIQRSQTERNELLGRLFNEHQDLQAQLQSRQDEVDAHRRESAGQDSFSLQRRALELQSRKLLLGTGLSLWRNIATGYNEIEAKEQRISTMRLQVEHLNRNIDALETEVRRAESLLQQKTYHFTLSKSQNLIELRADLNEGQPCSVCGATHHPWSGEGVSEQNVLISSMKTECETLEEELKAKRTDLNQMHAELTATNARLEVEKANYQQLLARQQMDTSEWQNFVSLDRSFIECSRSTNREARTAMMQQLIEKTTVDAERAEKELNVFTFHLNAITRVSEEIKSLQQTNSELVVRLNEVNTACQVLANQSDRISSRLVEANNEVGQRYEALEREITLPGWQQEWKMAPESLKMRILEMQRAWHTLSDDIRQHEEEIRANSQVEALLTKEINEVLADALQIESASNKAAEQASKAKNELLQILPATDGITLFNSARENLEQQNALFSKKREEHTQKYNRLHELLIRQQDFDDLIHQDEARLAAERSGLDLWMRSYNANNPPVQFAELERVLADGEDWTDIRRDVREVKLQADVTQSRIDYLRTQLIALQAAGVRTTLETADQELQSLSLQQETLESQRRTILQQIAHFDEQLRSHEQAIASASAPAN